MLIIINSCGLQKSNWLVLKRWLSFLLWLTEVIMAGVEMLIIILSVAYRSQTGWYWNFDYHSYCGLQKSKWLVLKLWLSFLLWLTEVKLAGIETLIIILTVAYRSQTGWYWNFDYHSFCGLQKSKWLVLKLWLSFLLWLTEVKLAGIETLIIILTVAYRSQTGWYWNFDYHSYCGLQKSNWLMLKLWLSFLLWLTEVKLAGIETLIIILTVAYRSQTGWCWNFDYHSYCGLQKSNWLVLKLWLSFLLWLTEVKLAGIETLIIILTVAYRSQTGWYWNFDYHSYCGLQK